MFAKSICVTLVCSSFPFLSYSMDPMPLLEDAVTGKVKGIEHFLDCNQALVCASGQFGATLLHRAVIKGNCSMAKLLLEHGAKAILNTPDSSGYTPVHTAATYGREDMAKLFVETYGACVDTRTKSGTTTIASAVGNVNILRLFLQKGAAHLVNTSDERGVLPLHLAAIVRNADSFNLLLEHGAAAMLDASDSLGATPLYWACSEGCEDIVKALLQKNADVNKHDHAIFLPLYAACKKGSAPIAELLIKAGATVNPDMANSMCNTPLYEASRLGHAAVVSVLLKYQADVHKKNYKGRTPLHSSARHNHGNIARLLLQAGAANIPDESGNKPSDLASYYSHEAVAGMIREWPK